MSAVPTRANFIDKLGNGIAPPDAVLADIRTYLTPLERLLDSLNAFDAANNLDPS